MGFVKFYSVNQQLLAVLQQLRLGYDNIDNIRGMDVCINTSANNAEQAKACLLYTSDAADELCRVDLGGRRIIKKKIF